MIGTVLITTILFVVISLLSAVAFARSRGTGIGRRVAPPADPFSPLTPDAFAASVQHRVLHERDPFRHPFGEQPTIMPGYTREQLEEIARRPVELHHDFNSARRAAPADQGSGGDGTTSQGAAAARPYRGRERRAF